MLNVLQKQTFNHNYEKKVGDKNGTFLSQMLWHFSLVITDAMAEGAVKGLGDFLMIFPASAIEATMVKNAREHGWPVI